MTWLEIVGLVALGGGCFVVGGLVVFLWIMNEIGKAFRR